MKFLDEHYFSPFDFKSFIMLYWTLNLMKSYQTIKASWQHSFQHFPKHRQSKNQKLPTAQENHLHTIHGIIFPFRSPHTLTHVSGPWICKRVCENPSLWSVGCGGQNDTFMEEVVWVCVWAWIWLTNTHLCWSWCRALHFCCTSNGTLNMVWNDCQKLEQKESYVV